MKGGAISDSAAASVDFIIMSQENWDAMSDDDEIYQKIEKNDIVIARYSTLLQMIKWKDKHSKIQIMARDAKPDLAPQDEPSDTLGEVAHETQFFSDEFFLTHGHTEVICRTEAPRTKAKKKAKTMVNTNFRENHNPELGDTIIQSRCRKLSLSQVYQILQGMWRKGGAGGWPALTASINQHEHIMSGAALNQEEIQSFWYQTKAQSHHIYQLKYSARSVLPIDIDPQFLANAQQKFAEDEALRKKMIEEIPSLIRELRSQDKFWETDAPQMDFDKLSPEEVENWIKQYEAKKADRAAEQKGLKLMSLTDSTNSLNESVQNVEGYLAGALQSRNEVRKHELRHNVLQNVLKMLEIHETIQPIQYPLDEQAASYLNINKYLGACEKEDESRHEELIAMEQHEGPEQHYEQFPMMEQPHEDPTTTKQHREQSTTMEQQHQVITPLPARGSEHDSQSNEDSTRKRKRLSPSLVHHKKKTSLTAQNGELSV
mmetsp:Transcript_6593/g.24685  ORF Transcript_6593/g.24685 Transcript_6593/m.24685 type:complete len:487 (-) Transcript_6593:1682-3142(-)